ncbi:uncharacterized protein LOC124643070 isoform X3 [Helicoverpa zea]|uniref:uncharacterized protein LOC124643070 isoform X3 n=1 Tax=Helicoverpa zea TaxID=7113 RepID=UPI001F5A6FEE|nr:uncharacterized protein LOC124643070 isoform X3 [Helicoverpa zea]
MDDEDKLPLKRVEFSLNKFNEVAIPHHLDLLRQHKANIIKYSAAGEWTRARGEQTHARRVAAQLRALLAELDALRRRVRAADLPRFDARTQRSRDTTLRAIVDYLETSPVSINRASDAQVAASATSTESVGVVAHQPDAAEETQIQLVVDHDEAALREREELLRGWSELQSELRALHDVWQTAQAAALAQRDHVAAAAGSVDAAADNVSAARAHLAAGERLRAGAWGASGAALGLLAGGPVGLAVGAKAGALAAAAGSLLGYAAARLLGRRAAADTDKVD